MKFFSRTTVLILTLLFAAACTDLAGQPDIVATIPPPPTQIPIEADTPAELGEAIFVTRCASCHGETGRGDGAVAAEAGVQVPDFTNPQTSAQYTMQEWIDIIRLGRLENLMPPWQNSLTPEEIEAVAEYTYNMWRDSDLAAAPLRDDQTVAPDDDVHNAIVPETTVVEETLGTVTGTVTMMTEGAITPDNLSVGLHVLSQENEQIAFNIQDFEGATFTFEEVTIRSDYNYMVTVLHDEVVFSSETVSGYDDTLVLPVNIYDTTDNPDVLDLNMLLLMVKQESDALVVQQFARLQNRTDTVYRGTEQINELGYEAARFTLPEEAILLNGEQLRPRFQITKTGEQTVLIDTKPIIPGDDPLIEIMYALPIRTKHVPVSVPLAYDLLEQPEILTSPVNVVNGNGFSATGVQEFDFGSFQRYYGEPASAGEAITFRVTTVGVADNTITPMTIVGIVLVIGGTGFIVFAVVMLIINQRRQAGHDLTREALLRTIAQLDTQFHTGELDEAAYRKRRDHLKQQLATLIADDK